MTARLLLLHGWGFDAGMWDGVQAALPGVEAHCWDRGYFGSPALPAAGWPALAVGHSLGALLLAAWLPAAVPLIAINGFDRFTGADALPHRVVQRMQARFAQDPATVLAGFRTRCGAAPAPRIVDEDALAADLAVLAGTGLPPTRRKVLVLHGGDDPLLPPEMRARTFAGAARETLDGGGHLLPLTHPGWCAQRIAAWL